MQKQTPLPRTNLLDCVMFNNGLKLSTRLVYATLKGFAGKESKCCPSIAAICERVGLGKRSVMLALRQLEQRGIVTRSKRTEPRKGSSNSYLLHEGKMQ